MKQRAAEAVERIDRALEEGELDEETVDELVDLLTPGESAPWPELEAVLYVAEHELIASDLQMHAVPNRLERAIGEALEAVLPLLGIRPYGPTFKIAEIARRTYDAETEKFRLVCERLEAVDQEERVTIVGRYLDTEPAPLFVNRMRQRFPSAVEQSSPAADSSEGFEILEGDHTLIEALESADSLRSVGVDQVHESLRDVDDPARVAREALASDRWKHHLLGGALMAAAGLSDLASIGLRRVTEGSPAAPQLAVFCAREAPDRTRHALSTFLAEVSWQNPELPEAELTDSRVRAILSARAILARIDTPLDPIEPDELSVLEGREELRRIPDQIDAYWNAWSGAKTRTSDGSSSDENRG